MNRQLLLLIAVCLLILSWFINLRHYLCTWIARFRSQPSIAKYKRKNKIHPFPFPTKRPECPLCKSEEGGLPSEATPEPPPLIPHKRGRRRSIYTDRCFCPNCCPTAHRIHPDRQRIVYIALSDHRQRVVDIEVGQKQHWVL